jgi:hypothetical protein
MMTNPQYLAMLTALVIAAHPEMPTCTAMEAAALLLETAKDRDALDAQRGAAA